MAELEPAHLFSVQPNFNCPGSGSRGDLPVNFLKGSQEPLQYLQSIDAQVYSVLNPRLNLS